MNAGEPGFGVYVHWPFCAAKCPYCDFNSHVRHQPVDQERFAAAFAAELATMRARTGPRQVTSIFLGGGTPSLMKPQTVGAVLDAVAKNWTVIDGAEITLEANPSSVEASRFRGYRAAGVNRVSLGVQALNDRDLKFLGRLHNVEEALTAIGLAREIFPRLSFDLIYARPGQTVEAWAAELEQAIGHAVDHLSLYQLTIEEGTPFHALHAAKKFAIPEPDLAADLYAVTQAGDQRARAAGLRDIEPCQAGRRKPAQSDLLALRRICRRRAGRAWPLHRERQAHRHHRREDARDLAQPGRGKGPRHHRRRDADPIRGDGRVPADGAAGSPRASTWRATRVLSGKPFSTPRLSILQDEGLIEQIGNSRLRATPSGMIVLDAVVADLAR